MYFFGVFVNRNECVDDFLFRIFGLSYSKIHYILLKLGIRGNIEFRKLGREKVLSLESFLYDNIISGLLLSNRYGLNKSFQIEIKTYRGLRLSQGFPSHGQRIYTNAKTAKRLRLGSRYVSKILRPARLKSFKFKGRKRKRYLKRKLNFYLGRGVRSAKFFRRKK